MPRVARKKHISAVYYIQQSASLEGELFCSDEEKDYFITILLKAKKKFDFKLFSFCLKPCSFEFVIFDNGSDISKIMKSINISYAMYKKIGHPIFKDRYKSMLIETNQTLLAISKEMHCSKINDQWNSKCAYNLDRSSYKVEDLVDSKMLYGVIADDLIDAKKLYTLYINSREVSSSIQCKKEKFDSTNKKCIQTIEEAHEKLSEVAGLHDMSVQVFLSEKVLRDKLICDIRKNSTLSMKAIGTLCGGLGESTISKILSR